MKLLLTTFEHTSRYPEKWDKTSPLYPGRQARSYMIIREKSWEIIENSLFSKSESDNYLDSIQKLMFEFPIENSIFDEWE